MYLLIVLIKLSDCLPRFPPSYMQIFCLPRPEDINELISKLMFHTEQSIGIAAVFRLSLCTQLPE